MRAQPPPVSAGGLTPERRHAGRYALERELGRGGMATVYLAQDERHGRRVAVKVLRAELARELGAERFLKEIATVAPLRHPYIVPLFDSGDDEGVLYYVMPYVEGESLRERLARERQLPIDAVISIACDVAEALDCAHRAGVVHRDVKPENVLLDGGHALVTDFGVAQAVAAAGSDRLTGSGMVVGTPAYMSPEQATGDTNVDARSDVYALGCVVYEMLAGEPPFTGPTRQAILAKHASAPVPPLHIARPGIPAAAERAIEKALAKTPADRWATAGEFTEALEGALAPSPTVKARRRWVAAGGAAAAALTFTMIAVMTRGGDATRDGVLADGGAPDTTRVAVLPLDREPAGPRGDIDDDLLHEAFTRWRGIVVVDRFQVTDAIRRRGPVRSRDDALALSASLGAGRYVRGGVARRGEGWRVSATLFDVGSARPVRQATESLPADPAGAAVAYSRLVDSLLLGGANVDDTPRIPRETGSLPARQAAGRGWRALEDWDLVVADSAFQAAVGYDPDDAAANLWLAQVNAWRELPSGSWSVVATRAANDSLHLSAREAQLAAALVHLASGRYADACRIYEKLTQRNSRDFAAWFGRGQCRTMDRRVVQDSSSPSGWRFRSSYAQAVDAYVRAFELLPSIYRGYERGGFRGVRILLLASRDLVNGYGPDSSLFYARPAMLGDSIALIPYPLEVAIDVTRSIPPGFSAALARQRGIFRRIAAGWSTAFPRSAGAKHAVAISLDILGDPSAIDTIRLARQLATDPIRRLEFATAEVLMRVKFGVPDDLQQVVVARTLADSLLARRTLSSADAELLAPIASIRGRCSDAAALARRAEVPALPIPAKLWLDAQAFLARASLGCETGATTPTLSELDVAISRSAPASSRATWVDVTLLYRQTLLASSPDQRVVARLAGTGDYALLRAKRAVGGADVRAARSALSAFGAQWRSELGPPTPDVALPAAQLWLATGDTTTAIQWLDRTLDLTAYDPNGLADQARAGALIRSMVLRADLAVLRGDARTARQWGAAVATLWSNADHDLQPALQRMNEYGRP